MTTSEKYSQQKDNSTDVLADYDYWFSKKVWTLEQTGALVIGLNPDVVLNPDLPKAYEENAPGGKVLYQLWRYTKEFWNWHYALDDSIRFLRDRYNACELDHLVKEPPACKDSQNNVVIQPMEMIQWCVDESRGFHYKLTEYLKNRGYDFRFSENSKILSEIKIFSKQEIWPMPSATRLILGLPPESTNKWLEHIRNYYRHLDGNYTQTKRDEVYYVMETALQSWKTGGLQFFNIYGDPEDGYHTDEECGVEVEAKVFVDWAMNKGFNPPAQLLELMGLQEAKTTASLAQSSYITPYITLMYEAINAFEITNDNQPAKQVIVSWLRERNPNLSGREVEYLATFIRMPEMKKGGFYKGRPE